MPSKQVEDNYNSRRVNSTLGNAKADPVERILEQIEALKYADFYRLARILDADTVEMHSSVVEGLKGMKEDS